MNFSLTYSYPLFIIPALIGILALFFGGREKYLILRLSIYLVFLLILLQPAAVFISEERELPRVGIFIDTSRSISLENRPSEARRAASEIIELFRDRAEHSLYGFNGDIQSAASPGDLDFTGDSTDLTLPLKEGNYDLRVIITDGNHNLPSDPLSVAARLNVPVVNIGVGGDSEIPDLEISDLRVPGIGFRHQDATIGFTLLNRTRQEGSTIVRINREESLAASKRIELRGRERIPVEMSIPLGTRTGRASFSLRVSPLEGEVNLENNTADFGIEVNREKIRILYVSGKPSWEYSFFRRFIISDPQVELVSFLILRNPDNVSIVPDHELSLIHFPAREMFTSEIYNFDLLIYNNFSYRRFFPVSYLEHIKSFVSQGGAFIMTGGMDSFARGGYRGTPIADILPVMMDSSDSSWNLKKFRAEPSGALTHPILSLTGDTELSRRIWSEMPFLEGYDSSLTPKNEAEVLLKGPGSSPILSVMDYGRGRSMALNLDSTWRWCMGLAADGRSPHYYNEFWRKLVRYMIQSSQERAVQVIPGRRNTATGRRMNVNIRVMDSSWEEINDARVTLRFTPPSGDSIRLGEARSTGSGGWYSQTLIPEESGSYIIEATAYRGDTLIGSSDAHFTAEETDEEMRSVSLNEELLRNIAGVTEGLYFREGETEPKKIRELAELSASSEIKIRRRIAWDSPVFYFFLVVALALEWFLRRRRGLS